MSLAGLSLLPMLCKVSPLFQGDKSEHGRPWQAGVWPPAGDEESSGKIDSERI